MYKFSIFTNIKMMTMEFKEELMHELECNILPFWEECADDANGGFIGQITGRGERMPEADKGAILNGRILWAFSAAYGATGKEEYLVYASRAARYVLDRFIDRKFGGVYWALDYKGEPKETKKQFYALGFCIYGLSEYARVVAERFESSAAIAGNALAASASSPSASNGAAGTVPSPSIEKDSIVSSKEALEAAIGLFRDIEANSYEPVEGGYIEALSREWQPLEDVRLSDKDENFVKTMNTHLHIIEPYANLYRIWKDPLLHDRLRGLLDIFFDKIENPETHHLGLFFDNAWNVQGSAESYGHDIEASWLLLESAQILGECDMLVKAGSHTLAIAKAALEGLQKDGSMLNDSRSDGSFNSDRDWWVQAETVIGTLYMWKFHGVSSGLELSRHAFDYIMTHIRDYDRGEWIWSIRADGSRNFIDDKAGFWKCPYHNSRMCLVAAGLL